MGLRDSSPELAAIGFAGEMDGRWEGRRVRREEEANVPGEAEEENGLEWGWARIVYGFIQTGPALRVERASF